MFVPKSLDDLKRIVKERLEETIQLEFKRELPPSGKNDDLAKDVAAMANAQGGVIVYGIEQDDTGRAKALHAFPISGAAERVTLVAQTLDEPLTLSNVDTILEGSQDEGFLIVEVQASERAPHFFKGMASGRTSKGNVPLTRRQIGELFARSPGFAQEFGLVVGRPGRVVVKAVGDSNLLFENDGDAEVLNAQWEWIMSEKGKEPPTTTENPFPIDVFPPGARVRVRVFISINDPLNYKVRTRWQDKSGEQHEQIWPITW